MKKNLFIILFVFTLAAYFNGCDNDVVNNIINECNMTLPDSGVYILSEGGFSPNSSALYYYHSLNDSMYQNIFCPGSPGLFPDGLLISGQEMYVTEQGNFGASGKIYKLNINGGVILSNNAGINPYSIAKANNKLYVTNGPAGKVTVIDANTLATIRTINVGVYPQEILSYMNWVYVCNTSAFGGASDSTVSVIDALSDSVIATITVAKDPSALTFTYNGLLLVGCPAPGNIIYTIDPVTYGKLDSTVISNGFFRDISFDNTNSDIFFISGNGNIVKMNLSTKAQEIAVNALPGAFFYGYRFDLTARKHYVLDAVDFSSSGRMYVFSLGGTLEKNKTVGTAPRRVEFRY